MLLSHTLQYILTKWKLVAWTSQGPCKVDSVIKAEHLLSIMDWVTVAIATVQLDFPRSKSHQRSLQEKSQRVTLHMNRTPFHYPQIKKVGLNIALVPQGVNRWHRGTQSLRRKIYSRSLRNKMKDTVQ